MLDFLKIGFNNIVSNIYNLNEVIFILIIFTLLIVNMFTNLLKKNTFILILFNFPGTFFHELAHFFVGILLFGKPVNFSIIPKINDKSITFGSVNFNNLNFINTIPIALAPYLLLPFSFLLIILYSNMIIPLNEFSYYIPLYSFIVYSTLISCFPSSVDWQVAFSNKIGLIFYLMLIYLFIFNFDIMKSIFNEVLK